MGELTNVRKMGQRRFIKAVFQNKIGLNVLPASSPDLPTHTTFHFSFSYLNLTALETSNT